MIFPHGYWRRRALPTAVGLLLFAASTAMASASEACTAAEWSKKYHPEVDRESCRTAISVGFENDLLAAVSNEDRDYTAGMYVGFSGQRVEDWFLSLHHPLHWVNQLWLRQTEPLLMFHTTAFSLSAFTPDDLRNPDPIVTDRPYASLLTMGASQTSVIASDVAVRSELSVGLLGTGIGEFVQNSAHSAWRAVTGDEEPYNAEGWNNQISDGGELTARYTIERYSRLAGQSVKMDLAWATAGSVGYYTNVEAGPTLRLGRIRSAFYAPNLKPMSGGDQLVLQSTAKDWEAYVFGSLRANGVLYNALLQGQFRDSPVTIDASDIKRLVIEGRVGGVLTSRKHVQLMVHFSGTSAEFDGPNSGSHYWGGVYITYQH